MIKLTDKVKLKASVDMFSDLTPTLCVHLITVKKCGQVTFNGSDGSKTYKDLDADNYDVVWSSRK